MKPILIQDGSQHARWIVRVLVGLALLAVGAAIHEWLVPSAPPFKGRLAWVADVAFELAGSAGLVALWVLLATALLVVARSVWRHTPKIPGDRWH